jgi:hypothetical protein
MWRNPGAVRSNDRFIEPVDWRPALTAATIVIDMQVDFCSPHPRLIAID